MGSLEGKVRVYRKKDGLLAKALEKKTMVEGESKVRIVVFNDTVKKRRKL